MKDMTISTENDSDLYQNILKKFQYRCLIDFKPYSHLHHIVPKSVLHPEDDTEDNIVLLCADCHEVIHDTGALNWIDYLRELRIKRLAELP